MYASITVIVLLVALYGYALAALSLRSPGTRPGDALDSGLLFVLLVPALNEERVISRTLSSLLRLRGNFLVLVIDDASEDGTVAAVRPFLENPRVRLLRQPPEEARRGKGHVLNAGVGAIRRMRISEYFGAENIIVTVFDADARVEPGFLDAVAPCFADPRVAGVQSAVRMYNADANLLTFWQNLEFAIWGRVMCRAKNLLGSATLGGNGQCVRLSALEGLGEEPWQAASLTEDLDLSLRLLASGGGLLRFCPSATVWQEAVPELGRLVRQRSRWMQGHLVCWQHLPRLLRGALPLRARLDLAVFLLLPATVLPVGLASLLSWQQLLSGVGGWSLSGLALTYAIGFVVAPLAVAYLARVEGRGVLRSLLHGHLFVFYSAVWFLASVAAWWNILLGRRGWAKTARFAAGEEEPGSPAAGRSQNKEVL
ncbi:glycosyl transferase, family 2 [Rubrobacter xylanophilus DSM 9941]|uniref:Glycosyl transferase, family 2 n=1 Tax=Rubrobacter xylanophilus (strain DSM 9941 / JCM 11954 / NBRC 16129 / PRD-1) TaxID=266117 RepID=Q1AST4_RUBXD|nr:glycosyltransferase [Rubrobacter xylanophilus]ABG05544.1 glycosyl transferase, family 2 [Rubrobacter xylanophilus DSM 9941]